MNEMNSEQAKGAMNSVVSEAISNLSSEEREKLFEIADNLERNIDILEISGNTETGERSQQGDDHQPISMKTPP